jgi:hypothetical protein
MTGMNARYQMIGNPPSRYWITRSTTPMLAMITQRMFAARLVLISVYEAYARMIPPVINRIRFRIVASTIIE